MWQTAQTPAQDSEGGYAGCIRCCHPSMMIKLAHVCHTCVLTVVPSAAVPNQNMHVGNAALLLVNQSQQVSSLRSGLLNLQARLPQALSLVLQRPVQEVIQQLIHCLPTK